MIDIAKIRVIGGAGGNGCVAFRRTRALPKGGPEGGDGGDGGGVYAVGDGSLNTLLHLRYQQLFRGGRGGHGGGKGKTGARGRDAIVPVPLGTLVWQVESNGERVAIADVLDETPLPLARGGAGGRGNLRFANAVNQIPLLAEAGDVGEEAQLLCELKLLADVGIIGMPNAGKSTLITTCSGAKPKVASYPFTTLSPVLGMVARRHEEFLLVEIPGLIEGAHKGVGLGHDFLRHVARTRLLWHLVDGVTGDVAEQWNLINQELGMFSHELVEKPQLLVVNKADVMTKDRRRALAESVAALGVPYYVVSGLTGEGMEPLIKHTMSLMKEMPKPVAASTNGPVVHRPKPKYTRPEVWLEDGSYVVDSPQAMRLLAMANMRDKRVVLQLWREFKRIGVASALERAGVQVGDTVRMGKIELEWA